MKTILLIPLMLVTGCTYMPINTVVNLQLCADVAAVKAPGIGEQPITPGEKQGQCQANLADLKRILN